MSKTTTNQNETQTETENMLQEDQELQKTEKIDGVMAVESNLGAQPSSSKRMRPSNQRLFGIEDK